MTCPRCASVLEPTTLSEIGLVYNAHTCSACGGFWVGPKEIGEISLTVEHRWVEFHAVPAEREQWTPLTCPACPGGVVMGKVVSSRDETVVMDVCPTCRHVWLDRGEREAIEQDDFIAPFRDLLHELFGGHTVSGDAGRG